MRSQEVALTPAPGLLTIFPPWLPHRVEVSSAHHHNASRIALSFNLEGTWSETANATVTTARAAYEGGGRRLGRLSALNK